MKITVRELLEKLTMIVVLLAMVFAIAWHPRTVKAEDSETSATAVIKVTTEYNGWREQYGRTDTFRYDLAAVTDGAPLPATTTVTTKKEEPTAAFDEITYGAVGTYKYSLTGSNGGIGGVGYDTTSYTVTVTVERNNDTNKLHASVQYEGANSLTITNTFTPIWVDIVAEKQFSDWDKFENLAFEFELSINNVNAPLPAVTTRTVTRNARIASYDNIEFCEPGTYYYWVNEIQGNVDGVIYDTTQHYVTVKVAQANDNTNALTASVLYQDGSCVVIKNTYSPARVELKATKSFNDWNKAPGGFTFRLIPGNSVAADGTNLGESPMPGGNSTVDKSVTESDVTAEFGEIKYAEAGIYRYYIQEIVDDADKVAGVIYDQTEHEAVVTVSKDASTNALSAAVKYEGQDALIITNTYASGDMSLQVKKEIHDENGADAWENVPDDAQFKFTLAVDTTKNPSAPMPANTVAYATKTNTMATFDTITYNTEGVYYYTITESEGDVSGLTYDTVQHQVAVTVARDSNDPTKLVVAANYEDKASLIITNTFKSAVAHMETTVDFNDWDAADSFILELQPRNGAPMPVGKTDAEQVTVTYANHTAVFGEIRYEKAGTYEYTIHELPGSADGVTYDTTDHSVTVTVTKDTDNKLIASVKYDGNNSLTITNTFTSVKALIQVTAVYNGWSEGRMDTFEFNLASVTVGNPMPVSTSVIASRANPTVTFGELEFTKAGTYEYTVTERYDQVEGVTYDAMPHRVTVTVTKDIHNNLVSEVTYEYSLTSLMITNTYTEPKTNVYAQIMWDDSNDQDGKRPISVNLELLADGLVVSGLEATVTGSGNNWMYEWQNLPKNNNGTPIVYTVEETTINEYTIMYEGNAVDGLVIKNKYDPEMIAVSVNVVFDDNNDQDRLRPASMEVQLMADGISAGGKITLSGANNWTTTVNGLPKYRDRGTEITYSWEGSSIPTGYLLVRVDTVGTLTTLTYRHVPAEVTVKLDLVWVADQDLTVNMKFDLYRQSTGTARSKVDSKTGVLDTGTGWSGEFNGLPKYDGLGNEYQYEVVEEYGSITRSGNAVSVKFQTDMDSHDLSNDEKGIGITCTQLVDIPVQVTWDGGEADTEDIIQLYRKLPGYADYTDTGRKFSLTKANGWSGSFQDYPKYANPEDAANGSAISYEVRLISGLAGYTTAVTGDVETGFTIRHTASAGTLQITASFAADSNSKSLSSSDTSGVKITVTAPSGETTYQVGRDFTNGVLVLNDLAVGTYTVTEDVNSAHVDGYTLTVTGNTATVTVEAGKTKEVTIVNTYAGAEIWESYIYESGEKDYSSAKLDLKATASGNLAMLVKKAVRNGSGKWVRYGSDGSLVKGWYTVSTPTVEEIYYFDKQTGMKVTGDVVIDGKLCHFDSSSGLYQP